MGLTEIETTQVKVQIEVNGMRYETSGSADEVIPQVLQFLARAVPTYDLARRLLYVPDLAGLSDRISEFAKMTSGGGLLLARTDLAADKSILVILFMAHLAAKAGRRQNDSLSIEDIATGVGKATKTIRNVIVNLQKEGCIDRTDRGAYRISSKGLMHLEATLFSGPTEGGSSR